MTSAEPAVKALFFDVFGTLVDWRTSVAREAETHPGRARPPARLAGLCRRLAGRIPARHGGGPFRPHSLQQARRAAPAQSGAAGCRASDWRTCPTKCSHDLTLVWHRLDAWPEVPAALKRLQDQIPARAGVERQYLADGRSRPPQRFALGRHPRRRSCRRLQAQARRLSRRLRGVRSQAGAMHDGGGAFERSGRSRRDAACAPAISRGRTNMARAPARRRRACRSMSPARSGRSGGQARRLKAKCPAPRPGMIALLSIATEFSLCRPAPAARTSSPGCDRPSCSSSAGSWRARCRTSR